MRFQKLNTASIRYFFGDRASNYFLFFLIDIPGSFPEFKRIQLINKMRTAKKSLSILKFFFLFFLSFFFFFLCTRAINVKPNFAVHACFELEIARALQFPARNRKTAFQTTIFPEKICTVICVKIFPSETLAKRSSITGRG